MKNYLKRLFNYLKRLFAWAKINPVFWINCGLSIILICFLLTQSADWIQVCGLIFQIFGVWAVWHDLKENAKSFNKLGFIERTCKWVKTFPFPSKPKKIPGSADGISSFGFCASGEARVELNDGVPYTDFAQVKRAVNEIHDKIDDFRTGVNKQIGDLSEKIGSFEKTNSETIDSLDRKVQEAVVGNYYYLSSGAFWLAVGTFLSASPVLLRKLLSIFLSL
jgi:hypothetical protein